MEGLPYDFGIEDDKDDEDIEKKDKKRRASSTEALKEPEVKAEKQPEKPTKEKLKEDIEKDDIDTAPELDSEAPLERLSRVESEAIAQTMASERLAEIQAEPEEITSETLAAESFLENVEASGDIDTAYNETLLELGETALSESSNEAEVESETAVPVDPESLVADARNELTPNVTYNINQGAEASPPAKQTPETRPARYSKSHHEKRPGKVHRGIVDYLVGRRFGRISAKNRHEEIEQKLSNEVSILRNELSRRETYVRQLAQNRVFEKQPKKIKPAEAETIGKVLIGSEIPASEHQVVKQGELAGISAHTMTHAELVRQADRIKVENTSLKQIYETHLVGEKGLRRIVAEYLRGGNYRKILRRELLEREKDFERDPKLRDQASRVPLNTSHVELEELLQRSGIDWSEPQPTLGRPKVKPANLYGLLREITSSGKSARKVLDVVMISTIMAMAVIIVILILVR